MRNYFDLIWIALVCFLIYLAIMRGYRYDKRSKRTDERVKDIRAQGDERVKLALAQADEIAERAHADAERIISLLGEIRGRLAARPDESGASQPH
jgi:hypothetical protein